MTDAFALLNEPRRPWLDADTLKQKFLALSSELHPDRTHSSGEAEKRAAQEHYAELNAAYNCLRDPRERLRHLLELERGAKLENVQRIPAGLMDFSLQVSRLCREADAFVAERAAQSSPLLKAQFFEPSQEWTDKLSELNREVEGMRDEAVAQLKAIDAEWEAGNPSDSPRRPELLQRLETLWPLLSYFSRWSAQIQERMVRLSVYP